MMRVPYLWLFVTALCNARVSVDVSYLPFVPRGFFSAVRVVAAPHFKSFLCCACKFQLRSAFSQGFSFLAQSRECPVHLKLMAVGGR